MAHGRRCVLLVRPPQRPRGDRARREREHEGRAGQHDEGAAGPSHDGFATTTNLFSVRRTTFTNPRIPPNPSISPKTGISRTTAQGSHHLRRPPSDTPALSRRPSQYIQIT